MKICFSGGGTLGSVSPLLALLPLLRLEHGVDFLFIGTTDGPERAIVEQEGIQFTSIRSGKLRRYLDIQNVLDPMRVVLGCGDALRLLRKYRPDIMVSAGGYVSVPVAIACKLLRIPVLIHQQDIVPGLANKIMAPLAKGITVAFEESRHAFRLRKTTWTGNPVRAGMDQGSQDQAKQLFALESGIPTVLVLGGGTGALALNNVLVESLPELLEQCQVIHSAGKGKNVFQDQQLQEMHQPSSVLGNEAHYNPYRRYHVQELIPPDEMKHAYAAADVVVTRAGLSTLSELAMVGKPVIAIPIPHSQQEENVRFFEQHGAVVSLPESLLTPTMFVSTVNEVLKSESKRSELSKRLRMLNRPDAAQRMVSVIKQLLR